MSFYLHIRLVLLTIVLLGFSFVSDAKASALLLSTKNQTMVVPVGTPRIYSTQFLNLSQINSTTKVDKPVLLKASNPQTFINWTRDQKPFNKTNVAKHKDDLEKKALMKLGFKKYNRQCAMCHRSNGIGMPPTFPGLRGSKITTGPVKPNIIIVLKGVKNTIMEPYGELLEDKTIAAIITYTRNAWGNEKIVKKNGYATIVQPGDVRRVRKELGIKVRKDFFGDPLIH